MVLVDTSVWTRHLRQSDAGLVSLLEAGEVVMHPYVICELACGGLAANGDILGLLHEMPTRSAISHEEFLHFVRTNRIVGAGVGFVDVHLLASAVMHSDYLWTLDKSLCSAATRLRVAWHGR